MKSTFGKIGMGVAGAVAFAGLMSAGVQTARAQLEISAPIVTNDLTTSGVYDWTYTISLQPSGSTLANPSEFALSMASNSELVQVNGSYYSSTFLGSNGWSALDNIYSSPMLYGEATFAGTSGTLSGTIGTFTIYSNTDHATTIGSTIFSFPETNSVTTLVASANPGTVINSTFASLTNEDPANSGVNPSTYTSPALIPSLNGSVVLSPLPLPAAFWPGLLTIGGMAVVGGLRLRRRTV